jgi:hypothetical protein
MRISFRRQVHVAVAVLTLASASPALAQKVTLVPDLTGKQVLEQLANQTTGGVAGDVLAVTTAAEIATVPFGTSSGGFVFKLDPATGLLQRTTTSFGPSFAASALTAGEGKVSIGATFSSTSYDKLTDFSLSNLPMGTVTSPSPIVAGTTTGNLDISSTTLAMSGTVGVTPKLEVSVVVPLVTVKVSGISTFVNANGVVGRLVESNNKFSGLGDIAAIGKFRLLKFKGPDVPDPGGIALNFIVRLPTGSRDNLRGLGVTRTLASVVGSFGKGPLKPHGSVGFEYWNKAVAAGTDKLRNQVQYAAGVEIVAAPKVTFLVDVLGQRILGAGPIGLGAVPVVPGSGATSAQSLVFLDGSINKVTLIPGLKVNLLGKMVLSLNALVTLKNNGLHSKVTPVAGLNLTM